MQYQIHVYNLEEIENMPDQEIQFTINDQLFFYVLLLELRGKPFHIQIINRKRERKKENI